MHHLLRPASLSANRDGGDEISDMSIPAHIPPTLVYDFDIYQAPELLGGEPHRAVTERLHREAPPVFYTTRNGGHWVVTRTGIALDMLRRIDLFSSDPAYNSAKVPYPRMLPNQVDPPDHTEYRRLVNGAFAPAAMERLEPSIRALASRLIDRHLPRGGCEFVADIGDPFPVEIFLQMAGAPLDDAARLTALAGRFTRTPDREERSRTAVELSNYLRTLLDQRTGKPGDDLLNRVANGRFGDRALNEDEKLGLSTLLFLGGLDTVKATLSFVMAHLARHPDQYRRLVESPPLIGRAVEELIRVHGVAQFERGCTRETDYEGIHFVRGDRFVMLSQIWGLDDQETPDPFTVDLDREVSRHLIFGAGPHRCVGSNLARVEIRVFLEEWAQRIPAYRLAPGTTVPTTGGIVWSPLSLPLVWP